MLINVETLIDSIARTHGCVRCDSETHETVLLDCTTGEATKQTTSHYLNQSLHLNDNTWICSVIQSSKLVLGSLLAKNNFFVQFWTKNFASSRMANCGSGLPAEWPFRSQNAIEASDSPLPGGLWVKRLITHALCFLAYSDIAWCKLFLIFTLKCLYWVFFAYKTPYSVLIDNSIHIQETDTEKTWLTLQGQIFRCTKHLSISQLKYLNIVSVKYFR